MESLQVLTPHRKCIFNCPFCISRTHRHNNLFQNNYEENHEIWKNNFVEVITNNRDIKYVVITGTNEPMQDKNCVNEIIDIVRFYRPDIQIEIQTRYYKNNEVYDKLDVVAYSISDYSLIKTINVSKNINRFVIILTSSFNNKSLKEIINEMHKEVSQLTFKVLHDSNGYNKDVDDWIKNNRTNSETANKLKLDVLKYKGNLSIRYDENSMDADNRYKVFREDGKVYNDWEEV